LKLRAKVYHATATSQWRLSKIIQWYHGVCTVTVAIHQGEPMKDTSMRDYVIEQLADLGTVTARAMFGGYGLYFSGLFFGLIAGSGELFFKTDESNADEYISRGMRPFTPNARQTLINYYEVPADILDDSERLVAWARKSVAVAQSARAARPAAKGPGKTRSPKSTMKKPPSHK
jgi:DNA transformation protein